MKKPLRTDKTAQTINKPVQNFNDETDYKKLAALGDDDIDYSDIPEKDELFWAVAEVRYPSKKKAISLRIDEDVLDWFKHRGGRYQSVINQVLRQYMKAHR